MNKKNKFCNNFTSCTPFNGIPCRSGEVLVPVIADDEMKITLRGAGLIDEYLAYWRCSSSEEDIPVAFIPTEAGCREAAMKDFAYQIHTYLNRSLKTEDDKCLSLEQLSDSTEDGVGVAYSCAGKNRNEEDLLTYLIVDSLANELSRQNPLFGRVFRMLFEGYREWEILEELHMNRKGGQGYRLIKKVQEAAKELYNRNYR